VLLFFVSSVCAFNYIDCDLLTVDVLNPDDGLLYTHVPFDYERNYYYNFTLHPVQSPVLLVPVLADTRHSPTLNFTMWLNDELIVFNSRDQIFLLPDTDVLTECGTTNHFIFETYDYYEEWRFVPFLNRTILGRQEYCQYQYELYLYNAPCQTVQSLYV
jgi:hypothetical protein